jgi:hypothetical protein
VTVAAQIEAPTLSFAVEDVSAVAEAITPLLRIRLQIDAGGREVRSLALNAQIRLDATRRSYTAADEPLLLELFGTRERWGRTMRSLLWTTVSTTVPRFSGLAAVDLDVPATYDFEVVAAKYLHALQGGEVPLELLFSGTLFYSGGDGRLQAAPISWEQEARVALPITVWRQALDASFPGSAWLRLDRRSFEQLWAYRATRALPSWEATLEALLEERA